MSVSVKVTGKDKLIAFLEDKARFYKKAKASVGFSANYALYVHENLESYHPVGEAKFLERPIMEMQENLHRQIAEAVRKGVELDDAILQAAQMLLTAAQERVPVKTGFLRDSGFARLEQS